MNRPLRISSRYQRATRHGRLQEPVDVARRDDSNQPAAIDYEGAAFAATTRDSKQVADRVSRAGRGYLVERTDDLLDQGGRTSTRRDVLQSCQGQESTEPAGRVMGWKGRVP